MNRYDFIEQQSRKLQRLILKKLFPEGHSDFFSVLEPEYAARVLDMDYVVEETLGNFGSGRDRFEVAGAIDRRLKTISVSRRFKREVIRFTGAHEIGHCVLHQDEVMHRDRPVHGLSLNQHKLNPKEREANYFAACFLVPEKLLLKTYRSLFGEPPFQFDENTSFFLAHDDPDRLIRPEQGSLDRELSLACHEPFHDGQKFKSLAEQFRVSATTMAIRLREVGIVQD